MKKLAVALLVMAIAALTALPASAQKKMKVTQVLNLGGESLDGELLGPNDEFMSGRAISIMNSLIQYRDSFVDEMSRDVEDL